jgi:hypothetical protein
MVVFDSFIIIIIITCNWIHNRDGSLKDYKQFHFIYAESKTN